MAKVFLAILLILTVVHNVSNVFRMTKVLCESNNESLITVEKCRLRPIKRGVSEFNLNVTVPRPIHRVNLDVALLKKANWYKPFLFSLKFDACEYFEKRNHPILNLIYSFFKDYTNINHTCPYVGSYYLEGFYLRHELLHNLPLPNGEYVLKGV